MVGIVWNNYDHVTWLALWNAIARPKAAGGPGVTKERETGIAVACLSFAPATTCETRGKNRVSHVVAGANEMRLYSQARTADVHYWYYLTSEKEWQNIESAFRLCLYVCKKLSYPFTQDHDQDCGFMASRCTLSGNIETKSTWTLYDYVRNEACIINHC